MSATSSPNTRITRLADRASYDRETAYAILDAALVAHLAVVVDGAPVVMPYVCARAGDELVLHGSTRAGILSAIAAALRSPSRSPTSTGSSSRAARSTHR